MRSAFVKVNRVPTRVTCWGKWIEESFTEDDCKHIVIMIVGNPGITGYYETFLETIHQQTGYHVWVLSHAGHEIPEQPSVLEMPQLNANHDLYNLEGQIAHKIAFIRRYVPPDACLHILGHSIGAYMSTNILDDPEIKKRIEKAYLLFPTIERMATSPNGKFYVNVVQRIRALLIFLSVIFALLPQFIRALLGRIVLFIHGTDSTFLQPSLTLVSPRVVKAIMFLADDEMATVTQRNDSQLIAHQDKLFAYFGQSDGWAPLKYCEEIRRDIPGIQVAIAEKDFEHAYVLKHSRQVAEVVSALIKAK